MTRPSLSERHLQRGLLGLGITGTAVFCLLPLVVMVATGLAARPDFLRPDVPFIGTLEHVRTVLADPTAHVLAYLRNSLVVAALSALLAVGVAALAAYALTRLPLPGKAAVLVAILALSMFPPVSLLGVLFRGLAALGWINTHQALVFPYAAWTLPLAVWVLVSYFARIPRELDQAALVDGCTRLQALRHVVLPLAAPGVLSTLLLAFVFAFNEFLFALMLTTDHAARTLPVGIALFEGLHGQVPWGEIMAAATVTTLPVVVLTLVFQRRMVQGLTRGAVKE
jgi:multiple sugar transport system permease protein